MIGIIFSAALLIRVVLDWEAMNIYEIIAFLIFSILFYIAGRDSKTYIYKEVDNERDETEDSNKD